jgi:hypothetical protein
LKNPESRNCLEAPTIVELQSFTHDSYRHLLSFLKQHYKIVTFRELNYRDIPYIALRHDIDMSPQEALDIAVIEKELNVKSTYFVLFSSPLYNVFEGNNLNLLKQISNLGHEIGLHYHPVQYKLYNQDFQKSLEAQVRLIESFTGKKVRSISRHGLWDRDPFATTHAYLNANNPYLRGDLFVHESDRAWTPFDGLSMLLSGSFQRAQLLVHPENWQRTPISREALLEKHFQVFENRIQFLKKDFLDYCEKSTLILSYEKNLKALESGLYLRPSLNTRSFKPNWRTVSSYYFTQSRIGWKLQQFLARIKNDLGTHAPES